MSGVLYIVATPIGNLKDLTPRALETFEAVDFILAEDPRVTLRLLNHHNIQKKVIPFSDHATDSKIQKVIDNLLEGESYALVSDAGTPAVSDPGADLVGAAQANDITVVPVVGASAVTAIVSVFGKPAPSFHFWGFWPRKLKKRTELKELFQTIDGIHVFFESPYRIQKTLEADFLDLNCHMVVGRELTKKFETLIQGAPSEIFDKLAQNPLKGEFVVALKAHK